MKLNYYYLIFLILFLGSCHEFDDDLEPIASFELSATEVQALEVIKLTNTGRGEFYTVFDGTLGHEYAKRDQGDSGIPGNERGDASLSYDSAGIFTVTFVASTYADGESIEKTSSKIVTVVDSNSEIRKIQYVFGRVDRVGTSEQPTYFVESFPDLDRRIKVPVFNFRHFGYASRADIIFKPEIDLVSNAATLEINNSSYLDGDTVAHLNFESRFRPIDYTVKPHDGSASDYVVSVLEIPEFETFYIPGLPSGINRIHPSSDHVFFISLPVSSGMDVQALTPEYTLFYPSETMVSLSGSEITSGGQVMDLSKPREIDLTFAQEGFEDFFNISSSTFIQALEQPEITSFSIDGVDATITLDVEGNPAEYLVDLSLPLPDGLGASEYLSALVPEFDTKVTSGSTEVRTTAGIQLSGSNQVNLSAYFNETDPFEKENKRSRYTIENYVDIVTDSATYQRAFSLTAIYKVGVLIE